MWKSVYDRNSSFKSNLTLILKGNSWQLFFNFLKVLVHLSCHTCCFLYAHHGSIIAVCSLPQGAAVEADVASGISESVKYDLGRLVWVTNQRVWRFIWSQNNSVYYEFKEVYGRVRWDFTASVSQTQSFNPPMTVVANRGIVKYS